MIMIMAIATIPYSTVAFDAKPVAGVAVGAAVAAAFCTGMEVSAFDPINLIACLSSPCFLTAFDEYVFFTSFLFGILRH